jgi:hypothetical protein
VNHDLFDGVRVRRDVCTDQCRGIRMCEFAPEVMQEPAICRTYIEDTEILSCRIERAQDQSSECVDDEVVLSVQAGGLGSCALAWVIVGMLVRRHVAAETTRTWYIQRPF